MRTLLVIAILATSILAGCTNKGGGGHDDSFTCPNGKKIDISVYPDHDNATFNATSKCPKTPGQGGNSTSNSTSRGPNVLPNLVFATKDSTGNATNITLLGGNLTFDATGSSDPDGNITGLAMTITDSNQTRTVSLFDFATKTFTPKEVSFDRAGRVNISVAVVDDRGGFATLNTQIFVNELIPVSHAFPGTMGTFPGQSANFPRCGPPLEATEQQVTSTYYYWYQGFAVPDEAGYIESTLGPGVSYWICSPENVHLSGDAAATSAASTDGVTPLPAARGVATYYLNVYKTGAPSTSPVTGFVLVHYEPKPAPAA